MRNLLLTLLALASLTSISNAAVWPASLAVENPVVSENASSLDNTLFSGWTLVSSSNMDAPIMGFGHPLQLSVNDALHAVKSLSAPDADFRLISDNSAPSKRFICYQEHREDLPVLSGRIDLVFGRSGELSRWNLREHSQWNIEDRHLLSEASASAILASSTDYTSWSVNHEQSFAAWYPDHESRTLRPVYWIRIEGTDPLERYEGIVDALSGETILDWPGVQSDVVSGTVSGLYWPEYMHEEPQVGPHNFEWLFVNNSLVVTDGINGAFTHETGPTAHLVSQMIGPYVEVMNDDIPEGEVQVSIVLDLQAPYAQTNIQWTEAEATRPELNLYYHTMRIWAWYKILDPEFTALDYPMPAVSNLGHAYDNAYWNGHGIYFGEGAQYNNFAMYSDIIYHEYTHGVTDGIYPNGMLPYIGQSGSMNEAWSDYFACTINGDPVSADYIGGSASGFRNLESNLVYEGVDYEVHSDSPIISAPLWTIRTALGAEDADYLAHFARYALAETYIDYLVAVLDMDDDDNNLTNGTPNYDLIYDAFGDHGVGPGAEPNFVIENLEYRADGTGGSQGNGNQFVEQGEIIALSFTVKNDVILYPPPATDVSITVTTTDPDITIENGSSSLDELGPAEEYFMSGVILSVAAEGPDRWAAIDIRVSSNGGSVVHEESIEFSIGTPRILIVQDDASSDVEEFVTATVRAQNKIFDTIELATNATLPDESIPDSGLIVWLTGNSEAAALTSEDQEKLRDFLDAGNKLVLSGQYLANGLIGTNFLHTIIEAEVMPEPSRTRQITAMASPFEVDSWFLLAGTGGASNQFEMAVLNPTGNSESVAYYGPSTNYPSIIQFHGGNGLLLGFGIEAISNTTLYGNSDRASFMESIYAWSGDVLAVPPAPSVELIPTEWSIGPAYPNPFNPSTRIPYVIPNILNGEYRIFDVMGRIVTTGILSQKTGTIYWEHSGPSGLYFLKVSWEGGSLPPQKLVLLK